MPDEIANDLYYSQQAKVIKINLIEIQKTNPSDLIITIRNDTQEFFVPLCLYKTEMVFLSDKYCWNTQDKDEFKFALNRFVINVEGEKEDFLIDFYYSTDQENPYMLFDESKNSMYRFRK